MWAVAEPRDKPPRLIKLKNKQQSWACKHRTMINVTLNLVSMYQRPGHRKMCNADASTASFEFVIYERPYG